ncbi:LptF/LptG family permease [Arcobacteraceae bacterium]|nr:LptF/LptG family permease [Arcobacteraceae bacterium]
MKIITKYLLSKYIKYFFIILISLELFFVGIDLLQYFTRLPNSANLQLLYVIYNVFFTLTITLPLSLVFGWIVTLTFLIKDNALVSFYALGISKKEILVPILLISTLFTFILIALQSTPLAYSYEERNKILQNRYFVNEQDNIFLKYNEYFVYFKKLYPIEKKAVGIHIFKTKDNDVVETIVGEKAFYQNNKWYVINTKITQKPTNINWNSSKLDVSYEKFLYTLEGFEPKIISNVYKGKAQYSVIDAVRAILLLDIQEFNTNKIKAILYSQVVMPFFVLPLIVLIFIYTTPSSRFFNSALFISGMIFLSLSVWGILFLLQKLALGSILLAEIAIIVPVILFFIIAYILYNKKIS